MVRPNLQSRSSARRLWGSVQLLSSLLLVNELQELVLHLLILLLHRHHLLQHLFNGRNSCARTPMKFRRMIDWPTTR